MKLSELVREIPGASLVGQDREVKGLCADSRVAGAGELFFCFCGTKSDSHTFALEAEERGVCAVMCERDTGVRIPQILVADGREGMARACAAYYGHPEKKLKIIGITGTNGKTTTATMLADILEEAGKRVGLIGTLGARYSGARIAPSLTTPDPVSLFSLLADMVRAQVEFAVMEVSAHALALKKDCPIYYDTAVFTNLTQDHLDFFSDMKAYGEAKKGLFSAKRCNFSVLNADDEFSKQLYDFKVPCKTYGLESPADSFALVDHAEIGGTHAFLNLSDELVEADIRIPGVHNVYNALAAATVARRYGAGAAEIARALSKTRVEGRLERVARFRGADVVVDFAHTPDGLEKSLNALREFCKGRLILLFGCGGNRDAIKRSVMGERAARLADFAVITSDNPRYEEPLSIIAEIEKGFQKISKQYTVIEEREKAIEYAVSILKKGDVLLVAGKGGEHEQEIMGIKYEYSDKTVIDAVIGKLS